MSKLNAVRIVIHWFRRDLRLQDNTALHAAIYSQRMVVPLFILDPVLLRSQYVGAPRVAFMLEGLRNLDESLRTLGSGLLVRHGRPEEILPRLAHDMGAEAIYWNADYSPYARQRDMQIERALDIPVHRFDDTLILPPGTVLKDDGEPYTVFTPFMRRWRSAVVPQVIPRLRADSAFHPLRDLAADRVPSARDLGFDTSVALPAAAEAAAERRLSAFLEDAIFSYADGRNSLLTNPFEGEDRGTSVLSPYLRFGMVSARMMYERAREVHSLAGNESGRRSVETWINELIWREFYTHILFHFPHVMSGSFRPKYDALQWLDWSEGLEAWQKGRTGFPIVDAAMRQLRTIGWMSNRARMIVASFLTKDLLISWRHGERFFMQNLIDGDPAANNGGWQWAAGTGTDAQPYFRIFNPASQSQKFDPDGEYIRAWVPGLRDVSAKAIHSPSQYGMRPEGYPAPIVDHKEARERTLRAFKALPD